MKDDEVFGRRMMKFFWVKEVKGNFKFLSCFGRPLPKLSKIQARKGERVRERRGERVRAKEVKGERGRVKE